MIQIPKAELDELDRQITILKKEKGGTAVCIKFLDAYVKKTRELVDIMEGLIRYGQVFTLQAMTFYLETGLELAKERKEAGIDSIEKNLVDTRSQLNEAMKMLEEFIRDTPAAAKILTERYHLKLSTEHAGGIFNEKQNR